MLVLVIVLGPRHDGMDDMDGVDGVDGVGGPNFIADARRVLLESHSIAGGPPRANEPGPPP